MADRVIKAALLGLGTVGGGVYKVLKMQEEEMIPKLGAKVELKKILVRNIEKASKKIDDPSLLTNNWKEIVEDPEIEIVIELIGGMEPARTYILESPGKQEKNVVTANKDLIAADGHILLDTAAKIKRFLTRSGSSRWYPDHSSDQAVSCRKSYLRSDGYHERNYQLYPD